MQATSGTLFPNFDGPVTATPDTDDYTAAWDLGTTSQYPRLYTWTGVGADGVVGTAD